jgi:DNA-binding response OmpR family regulator
MPLVNHISIAERLAQAAAHLREAILLIEEVAPGIVKGLVPEISPALPPAVVSSQSVMPAGIGSGRPSIIDETTFSVRWADRTCRLGNTVAFRLLARLARRPNQLVSCETLLDELWDRYTSREAVRSTVKILRRKLTAAGMEDLAAAIDGSTSHYYALTLAER